MTTETTTRALNARELAEYLGFTAQAVKKWRGNTIKALTRAGQLNDENPSVLLPSNALPLPVNQAEHVLHGAPPLYDPAVCARWAEHTQRRHPVTKEPMRPAPPGVSYSEPRHRS